MAGGVEGSGEVDTGEEAGGGVDVVEGEDAVDGERVGGDFAVEKLGEVAVEGAVGAAEEGVGELEVGDEDPCVEWDYSLAFVLVDFVSTSHSLFFFLLPRIETSLSLYLNLYLEGELISAKRTLLHTI